MNWVGGARNRLKTKDEKRRQKEFFEKMKYGSKVRRLSRSTSPRKANPPASLDLISLQAADFSAKKFDAEKGSKSKVKKVEMDLSKGLFPFHHHKDDLELSMSPGTPSKLQLQEPDERHPSYSMNYEEKTRTADSIFPSSAQKLEHAMQWIHTDNEDSKSLELREHDQIFQSSQLHSTPITQTLPTVPQQPLKHQGKHFEDLFFSFMPRGDETVALQDELSLAPPVMSEDDKLSDDFDYSPLSSIPSESSTTSSLATISPGSQPYLQETVYSTISSASQQEKETFSRKFVGNPADLTQNASPLGKTKLRCPNSDTLCEDLGSNSSPTTSGSSCRESPHPSKPQEEFESTVEKIDLLCEEQDSFLSPLGKNTGVATSGVKNSTRPCRQSDLPDTHSPENSTAVCDVSSGTPSAKELNLVEEENTFGVSCPTPGKANSLKWKAFISGDDLTEKPVKQRVLRNAKLTPTKAMSKVCEQVLKEVLQLDNELCKNSPLLQCSVSKTESLPSMMDFLNFPTKEKKDGMEEFSVLVTEDLTRNQETNNKQPAKLTSDQQVPDPGQQHTNTESEHVHFVPDRQSLMRTDHPKEIQQDNKRDGQRPDIQLQDEIKMSENTNGAEKENIHGKDLNASSSSRKPNIQLQGAITIKESNGTNSEEENDHARDLSVSGCGKKPLLETPVNLHDAERVAEMTTDSIACENLHPEKLSQPTSPTPEVISHSPPHDPGLSVPTILHVCEDKATQCNFCTTPSENKETQCTVNEFTCADTERNTVPKMVPENMYHPHPALHRRPGFDAYDGCMLS